MTDREGASRFWKLAAAGFAFKVVATFSQVLGQAVFLKVATGSLLPHYYIVANLISTALGVLAFRGSPLAMNAVRVGVPVVGVLFLAQGLDLFGPAVPRVFALYTGVSVLDIFAGILFWNAINERLTIAQLRRVVGFLGGWMHLGGLLAGAATLPLMRSVPIEKALVTCGLVYLIAPLVALAFGRRARPEAEDPTAPAPDEGAGAPESRDLLGTPLLLVALVTTACAAASRYLITFEYSLVIEQMFATTEELAGFVGVFDAGVKVLTLACQWLLVGRLASHRTLGGLMRPTPGMVLLFSALFLTTGLPLVTLACQLLFLVMAKSVDQAAMNRMLCAFPGADRKRASFLLQAVLFPVVVVLAGVYLIALSGPQYLTLRWAVILALSVTALVAVRRIDPAYRALLLETLAAGEVPEDEAPGASLEGDAIGEGFPGLGVSREGPAAGWMELDDDGVLAVMRSARDGRATAAVVRALAREGRRELVGRALEALLEADQARPLADAIDALGEGYGPWCGELVAAYLGHDNHRVRASAVLAIFRTSMQVETLKLASQALREMLLSDRVPDRQAGAVLLGHLGLDAFAPALTRVLGDPDPAVRLAALQSARLFPPGLLLEPLETRRGLEQDADVRAELAATLEFLRDEVTASFLAVSFTWPSEVRDSAVADLRKLESAKLRRLALRWAAATGPGATTAVVRHLDGAPREVLRELKTCVKAAPLDPAPIVVGYVADQALPARAAVLEALSSEDPDAVVTAVQAVAEEDRTWVGDELRRLLDVVGWVSNAEEAVEDLAGSLTSDESRRRDLGLEALEALGFPQLRVALRSLLKRMARTTAAE